ncbi:MAG TPA: co-chaperone GroES [Actinobacteria bacterium]|nr:co-chaperone GroES [Actinomycetota bacterium]
MRKIQPINNYVLIEVTKTEEKTEGGIFIPDTAREKPRDGEVISIATGASDEINIGDRVIYKEFSGTEVANEGEKYLLVPASDIFAKYVEVDSI